MYSVKCEMSRDPWTKQTITVTHKTSRHLSIIDRRSPIGLLCVDCNASLLSIFRLRHSIVLPQRALYPQMNINQLNGSADRRHAAVLQVQRCCCCCCCCSLYCSSVSHTDSAEEGHLWTRRCRTAGAAQSNCSILIELWPILVLSSGRLTYFLCLRLWWYWRRE